MAGYRHSWVVCFSCRVQLTLQGLQADFSDQIGMWGKWTMRQLCFGRCLGTCSFVEATLKFLTPFHLGLAVGPNKRRDTDVT